MRVLSGKQIVTLDRDRFGELCAARRHVLVDVGTGDARIAYRLARAHPDWLVVGIDPNWQNMVETAVRSKRKPARGGVDNLLLVAAAIETAPDELAGIADEVLVLMPWGRLLRGLVLGEPDVCAGVRRVAKPSVAVDVTIGTSIWRPPVPIEIRDLPELTVDDVRTTLAPLWARSCLRITDAELVSGAEASQLASSWARRLNSGRPESVMHIRAITS